MLSNRRSFLKNLGFVVSGVLVFKNVGAQEKKRAAKAAGAAGAAPAGDKNLALPLQKPGEGMAVSLNYVTDHKNIKDAKLKADRQGIKFEDQHCANCTLYTKAGDKEGGEVGVCPLFAGHLVKSTAWCSSWNHKV